VTEFGHLGSREGHRAAVHVERTGAELPPDLVFALDDEPGIERRGHRRPTYRDQLMAPAQSTREGKRVVTSMLTVVSRELKNTPAVCRRSYVRPAVVDSYLRGQLPDQWHQATARASHLLGTDERRLVHVLDRVPAVCAAA
jgi:hypothetical protein